VVLLIAALGGLALFWLRPRPQPDRSPEPADHPPAASVTSTPYSRPQSRETAPAPSEVPAATVLARLNDTADRLKGSSDPREHRRLLGELRFYLASLPTDTAVRALREYLSGRGDAPTKLGFVISKNGGLNEAPSLRVWLLDCLGAVDRQAAAEHATSILAESNSADEWAISLRDFALVKNSPADIGFVEGKMRELMHNPAWQQNPSVGFLEAFDTIVYLTDERFTPDLVSLVAKKGNRPVAHAAFLTLDRLVIEAPGKVLQQLLNNEESMAGREQTRANYFARADVSDPTQRELVERYLLSSQRTEKEVQTFAGLYPNANLMISTNLLTETKVPNQTEIAARDRKALTVVDEWLKDARFAALKPYVEQIRTRLSEFVRQAGESSAAP
jgi:hypothetical protein